MKSLHHEALSLFRLAIPLVISMFSGTLVGLIDTAMVGALGETALAAVSLTYSGLLLFYCGLFGLMSPLGILSGQAHGAADNGRAGAVLRTGLTLAALSGIGAALLMAAIYPLLAWLDQPQAVITAAAPYWFTSAAALIVYNLRFSLKLFLESVNRPWLGVGFVGMVVLLKYISNLLLIPRYGLLGAGMATIIAEALGFATLYIYIRRIAWCKVYHTKQRHSLHSQLGDGLPMAGQYMLEGGALSISGVLIGWLGAAALAANQIVFSVTSALYMMPLGIAAATAIRVAQAFGAGEAARLRAIGLAGIVVVTAWVLLFTLVLIVKGATIAAYFIDNQDVITVAAAMFISVGFMQIADGVQSVSAGVLRGILDVRWPVRVSLIAYWLIALPLGYVLSLHTPLGAAGIWAGFAVGVGVAALLLVRRFYQKTADKS